VQYRDGENWKPVSPQSSGRGAKDQFDTYAFAPVTTDALRLLITSQEGFAAGIHEWKVK
jgi:hypothetical protein